MSDFRPVLSKIASDYSATHSSSEVLLLHPASPPPPPRPVFSLSLAILEFAL